MRSLACIFVAIICRYLPTYNWKNMAKTFKKIALTDDDELRLIWTQKAKHKDFKGKWANFGWHQKVQPSDKFSNNIVLTIKKTWDCVSAGFKLFSLCWKSKFSNSLIAGPDVINKFQHNVVTLWWNKELWLVKIVLLLETTFISGWHSAAMLKNYHIFSYTIQTSNKKTYFQ